MGEEPEVEVVYYYALVPRSQNGAQVVSSRVHRRQKLEMFQI
jgi:hypothetical protein